MSGQNGAESLASRAVAGATLAWQRVNLSQQSTEPAIRKAAREEAAIYAQVAQTFAERDLADANRDLARANNQLALSVDAAVDELRRRRGVPDQA